MKSSGPLTQSCWQSNLDTKETTASSEDPLNIGLKACAQLARRGEKNETKISLERYGSLFVFEPVQKFPIRLP